jgi:hypothetical protein
MAPARISLLVVLAGLACSSAQVARDRGPAQPTARYVLPPPKEVREGTGAFVLSKRTQVRGEPSAVALLQEELHASDGPTSGAIDLELVAALDRDLGPEGYQLDVTPEGIHARATGAAGLFYAAQSLLQLVDPATGRIPAVHIVDWPEVKDRMALYDLRFDNFDLVYMKRWVHELSRMKINQLMLFLSGDYRYEKYPFVAPPEKLTRDKLRELKRYAAAHHVQLVPQVESLGHADGVLAHDQFRDLRLGPDNTYAYSPCTSRTYEVLGDFYRELSAELDQSNLFHVGGDEVWDFPNDPRCAAYKDEHAQSRLYSQHMTRLSGILHGMHRRMGIWSDMILKHPEAAEGLDRSTVIFDWDYSEDYKRFDDFPSLKTFQDLGFHDIYATAAVLGFNDMYPLLPVAFQNIRGFTQAALREQIKSVCVTIWETQPGNNAENYLYGLAWAGNIMWSPRATDLPDFNRRFASAWFGIRDGDAASHVDRALWFPWRVSGDSNLTEKDSQGFWQIEHRTAELLYMGWNEFSPFYTDEDLKRLPGEAEQLLHSLDAAQASIAWLDAHKRSNPMTIQSMQMTNAFYRFLAHKVLVLAKLSTSYRTAFAAGDQAGVRAALATATTGLGDLRVRFAELKRHLALAMAERNRGAAELETLERSLHALADYEAELARAAQTLVPPEKLGLVPKHP